MRQRVRAWLYHAGMAYGLFGMFSAQPGRRNHLVGHLLPAAQLLEQDHNCIHYVVRTSDEPEAVWVFEVWTDVAAHDASLDPPDIQALIQEARPLIAGMSDQTQLFGAWRQGPSWLTDAAHPTGHHVPVADPR